MVLKEDNLLKLEKEYSSSLAENLRLKIINKIIVALGVSNKMILPWIKFGDKLKEVDLGDKLKYNELKHQYFQLNLLIDESLKLYEEFDELLKLHPKYLAYWIKNEKYKIFALHSKGNKVECIAIGEKVINKIENIEDDDCQKILSSIYWITGGIATNVGDYEKCMLYFNKALLICDKFELDNEKISIYGALGSIYRGNKEFDKAKKYLKLGIKTAKKTSNAKRTLASMLSDLALIHLDEFNYDKTEVLLSEALIISKEIKNSRSITHLLLSQAEFYFKTKNFDKFFEVEKEIKDIEYFKKDSQMQSELAGFGSEISFALGDYKTALKKSDKYEKLQLEINGLVELKLAYKLKVKILKKLLEFEKATEYLEKIIELNKKLINESNKKSLNEFEAKFQNERKEKEIQALKLESVSFQLQFLKAQMNPHFIFNTIGSISADLKSDNIDKSKELLNNFSSLMRSTLDFAEVEKISLEEEIVFLNNYLNLEKYRLEDNMDFEILYDENLDIDFIDIPSMIIQPYVENAIKHGIKPLTKKGKVGIKFIEKEDYLLCVIIDNGIGRKQAQENSKKLQKHIGKSTTINAKRLSLIQSKGQDSVNVFYTDLFDENKNAIGTKVELSIKL